MFPSWGPDPPTSLTSGMQQSEVGTASFQKSWQLLSPQRWSRAHSPSFSQWPCLYVQRLLLEQKSQSTFVPCPLGQLSLLHDREVVCALVHTAVLPPFWATMQSLDLLCVPPPHVLLQLLQEPQLAQEASTVAAVVWVLTVFAVVVEGVVVVVVVVRFKLKFG